MYTCVYTEIIIPERAINLLLCKLLFLSMNKINIKLQNFTFFKQNHHRHFYRQNVFLCIISLFSAIWSFFFFSILGYLYKLHTALNQVFFFFNSNFCLKAESHRGLGSFAFLNQDIYAAVTFSSRNLSYYYQVFLGVQSGISLY